jgi:hypothetical protein
VIRTTSQNAKYQKLIDILYREKEIRIWDGRYELGGIQNPYVVRPQDGSKLGFRNFMKQLDLDYRKDAEGLAVSSTKLSTEELASHIGFLDALCAELGG